MKNIAIIPTDLAMRYWLAQGVRIKACIKAAA
jgi:hypothetical protein